MTLSARIEQLSPREKEVLDLLLQGLTNRQIAERLDASVRTVHVHLGRILEKTRQPNRLALVVAVYELLLNEPRFKK